MNPILWFLLGAWAMAQLLDLFAFNAICKKYCGANGWARWRASRERKKAYWPLGSLWLLLRANAGNNRGSPQGEPPVD